MKLSTTVKNYIKEEITKKYPISEEEKVIRDKFKEAQEKSHNLKKSCEAAIRTLITDMIENFYKDNNITFNEFPIRPYCTSGLEFPSAYGFNYDKQLLRLDKQLEDLKEARKKKIEEIYNNILVTMELGGTKAELDKLLAEIGTLRGADTNGNI